MNLHKLKCFLSLIAKTWDSSPGSGLIVHSSKLLAMLTVRKPVRFPAIDSEQLPLQTPPFSLMEMWLFAAAT